MLARGRVPAALDSYRCALQWAPHNVVTAAPVPCAQTLQALGTCFMKLGRLADAELCYTTAVQLATHPRLQADWHWVRSCRANAIGDKKRCADEALACIAVAPSYHWAAYHHAAWATYAKGERGHAIDLWLDGLRAFCDAWPVGDTPAYLDAALCYWKSASDAQIARNYEELGGIVLANPLTASNQTALTRVLAERQKLEKLFPERFATGGWQRLVQDAASMGAVRAADTATWMPASNPVYALDYVLFTTSKWERLLNEALWFEVNEEYGRAGSIYEFIIRRAARRQTAWHRCRATRRVIGRRRILAFSRRNSRMKAMHIATVRWHTRVRRCCWWSRTKPGAVCGIARRNSTAC